MGEDSPRKSWGETESRLIVSRRAPTPQGLPLRANQERVMGFEPTHGSLGSYCLSTWLHPRAAIINEGPTRAFMEEVGSGTDELLGVGRSRHPSGS